MNIENKILLHESAYTRASLPTTLFESKILLKFSPLKLMDILVMFAQKVVSFLFVFLSSLHCHGLAKLSCDRKLLQLCIVIFQTLDTRVYLPTLIA